jgi:hypothetical protein
MAAPKSPMLLSNSLGPTFDRYDHFLSPLARNVKPTEEA